MQRIATIVVSLCVLLSGLPVGAAEHLVEVTPGLSLDLALDDATFQPQPAIAEGNFICLWDGKVLKAIGFATYERFSGKSRDLVTEVTRSFRQEFGEAVQLTSGRTLASRGGSEVRGYEVSYIIEGKPTRQHCYLIRSGDGYYLVVFTPMDRNQFDEIGERSDRLMTSARVVHGGK